jgi:hypothetical protein
MFKIIIIIIIIIKDEELGWKYKSLHGRYPCVLSKPEVVKCMA